MFKDVYAEFLSLVEQSSGRSRTDLGFRPAATEQELADMEAELRGDSDEGEWLEKVGARTEPDLESWASVSWPLVRGVLASPPVLELLERITAEFYATLAPPK